MKIRGLEFCILLILLLFSYYTKAQNGILELAGSWSFGSAEAVDLDTERDLIFLSSGGTVLILDGSDRTNPLLLSDGIITTGFVEDLFYDSSTQRLYIAAGEGGLEIWDVSTSTSPQHLSTTEVLYVGAETPVGNVDVYGNFAIVECGFGYIHSLDVSDPLNPVDVSFNGTMGNPAYDLYVSPDGQAHTTGAQFYVRLAIQPDGTLNTSGAREFDFGAYPVYGNESVAYVGYAGYLYILELPNAAAPPLSITNMNGISDIIVMNNLAYILNSSGLQMWNVGDPINPFFTGQLSMSIYGSRLVVAEGYAYIANGYDGLKIVNVSDSTLPVLVGSYDVFGGTPDVFVKGDYAYLSQYSDGMIILDISDYSDPVFVSNFTDASYVDEIYVQGDYAYVADFYDGLKIVDVSNPQTPVEVGVLGTLQAGRIKVQGNYAYAINVTVNNPDSLEIIDVSNPSTPFEVGSIEVANITWDIDVSGNYVYIAAHNSGLRIINVSDPANPILAGVYADHTVHDVQVVGNTAYLASPDFNGGFIILDVSDPSNPTLINQYNPSGFPDPFDVAVKDNYAYISAPVGTADIILLDITNPNNPIELDDYNPPVGASDIQAVGPFLYIADGEGGVLILRNTLIPIPVELVSFRAENDNNIVTLTWITATELNNKGFEIQRKQGDAEWKNIGFVKGGGTSSQIRTYRFADDINEFREKSTSYRLKQIDFDGSCTYSDEVLVQNIFPSEYILEQNYPNPFNPSTTISYSIPVKSNVEIWIYNALGRSIRKIVNGEKEAGRYSVQLDAEGLPSGVYFYRIQAGNFVETRKMILLR